MSEPTGRSSSQELAELALQGYECPNADAPMHTAAGCSWCFGSAPYREAVVALAVRLRAAEQALRDYDNWASRMPDAGFTAESPRWDWWHERPYEQARRALEGAAE